jgi:23S rRNA pseudouridine1911/1915/1917 synthase
VPIQPIENNPRFRLVAEAADHVVVDKPAPLLVHPSTPGNPPTLLDGLHGFLAYEIANGARLSIINRLDRETSGLVLIALNKSRARSFHMAMQQRLFTKRYQALCIGWPDWEETFVDAPLRRLGETQYSPIWVRQAVDPAGADAQTGFRVLKRLTTSKGTRMALLECRPHTGRMHQIRVHLAHLGHPVAGDKIYGPDPGCYLEFIETGWTTSLESRLGLSRHALHSTHLSVRIDNEHFCWTSAFPDHLVTQAKETC